MEIKEFKKGDTAFLLNRHYRGEETVSEVYVASVGRKYVHIAPSADAPEWERKAYKQTDYNCTGNNILPYLEESDNWGNNRNFLFKSREGIDEYRERLELEEWYKKTVRDFNSEKKLSTEQLRKIREIITGKD